MRSRMRDDAGERNESGGLMVRERITAGAEEDDSNVYDRCGDEGEKLRIRIKYT